MYRFLQGGSESVSLFHLFHLFIDWSEHVGSSVSVWLLGLFVLWLFFSVCFSMLLTNHFDRVV